MPRLTTQKIEPCGLFPGSNPRERDDPQEVSKVRPRVASGHSLGGALSTLAAHDLAEEEYDGTTFHHINFASPRVFDTALTAYYDSLPVTTFRVVNVEDIVATVPPPGVKKLVYQHVGTPLCFSAQYGEIGKNHAMKNYLYTLEHPNSPQRPRI